MKYTLQEKLNITGVSRLIEEARNAELCRDIQASRFIFEEIWSNIEIDPDFSEYEPLQEAELLRLAGFFLSLSGKLLNLPHYQERGKDILTKAIIKFLELNKSDRAAEANVMLAGCYFFEGAIDEFELILEQTKLEFEGNHLHSVYLQICLNRVIATLSKKEYQQTFDILSEISVPMEFCEDKRLRTMFHEKFGMFYKNTGQPEKAIFHYNEAIKFAEESNNYLFKALNKNNLANLFRIINKFELAYLNENEAIKLAHQHNFIGWLPHFLDTKSLIYFDEGHYELALETIEEAISIFRKGEDANGLTESLWNKCKFLLHLNRKDEAILLFTDLLPIARQQMGSFSVNQFTNEFADLIHVKQNGSLDDELRRFKRNEIVNAIRQANYHLVDAAEILKINVTVLTKILDKEFPELYEELDIQHLKQLEDKKEVTKEQMSFSSPRKISQLTLQDVEITFAMNSPERFATFYVSQEKLPETFNNSQDLIVATVPINELLANDFVILLDKIQDIYLFGKVLQDKDLDLFYILDKDEAFPLFLNDFEIVGKVIGYCPFTQVDKDNLNFELINF